ncbi:hypothetical protein V6Z11_D09G114900 [Gossypium hirsutum]
MANTLVIRLLGRSIGYRTMLNTVNVIVDL